MTHLQMLKSIREHLSLEVSDDTVHRRLDYYVPAKKEYLTDAHPASRLAYAQQYVDKGMEFWESTIFTDERSFSSSNHGKIHLWRTNNTRKSSFHTQLCVYCIITYSHRLQSVSLSQS